MTTTRIRRMSAHDQEALLRWRCGNNQKGKRTMRAKSGHFESKIQQAVVRYLRLQGVFVQAVPNGGARSDIEAKIMKGEGVVAGASDLEIKLCGGVCVHVEMKTEEGRMSNAQKQYKADMEALGFPYMIWRSVDDAEAFYKAVVVGKKDAGTYAAEFNVRESAPKPKKCRVVCKSVPSSTDWSAYWKDKLEAVAV